MSKRPIWQCERLVLNRNRHSGRYPQFYDNLQYFLEYLYCSTAFKLLRLPVPLFRKQKKVGSKNGGVPNPFRNFQASISHGHKSQAEYFLIEFRDIQALAFLLDIFWEAKYN